MGSAEGQPCEYDSTALSVREILNGANLEEGLGECVCVCVCVIGNWRSQI